MFLRKIHTIISEIVIIKILRFKFGLQLNKSIKKQLELISIL